MRDPKRQHQYHVAYMNMAIAVAQLSHAERKKVGCILVNSNDQVVAQGYNGTPSGFDNRCEIDYCDKYNKPISKLEHSSIECCIHEDHTTCEGCLHHRSKTKEEVLHAESNAIAKCARSTNSSEGCTLYVTMSPCVNCAKTIIQSGIAVVYYLEPYKDSAGLDLLRSAGIEVYKLDIEGSYMSPHFIPDNITSIP